MRESRRVFVLRTCSLGSEVNRQGMKTGRTWYRA